MLLEFTGIEPGQWLIQNTANGAVGKVVAMLAAVRGINTINLVRSDARVAELTALCITNVVSTEAPDWKDQVRAIAGEDPISVAVDSVGGKQSGDLASVLGKNGLLVSFGTMTGEPMQIASGDLIFKHITVKGFWGSIVAAELTQQDRVRLITELITATLSGDLQLPVEKIFDLGDAASAAAASGMPGRKGKILLRA